MTTSEAAASEAGERLRAALELYEVGEAMFRARLRREQPDVAESEIEAQIGAWLQRRPGAEHGDCPGRPRTSLR